MHFDNAVSAVIDYTGNGEPTQFRASLWYATMLDASGNKLGGLASDDWGSVEKVLRCEYPGVEIKYTPRGWSQNVTEFEASRHYRR
jgi:hypothetical protein